MRFKRDPTALVTAAASGAFLPDTTTREALLVLSVLDPERAAAILVPVSMKQGSLDCRSFHFQQPSRSLPTPSAILTSVRIGSVPEHCPQDANAQQCCDWPMKPDSVRIAEKIDEYQKARNREGCRNGARQARQPIRDGAHPRGWLVSVANPFSASFRDSGLRNGAFV